MTHPVVKLDGMRKAFGAQPVLTGLDWEVGAGKVVGLLGRNGAGKSTLLECALGLRELDGGTAALFGEPSYSLSDAVRADIGYVPQKPALFDWLTAPQLLDYFRAMYPRWNAAKVEGLLQRWGFDAAACHKRIGQLSVGQQQRLSIIRALAHDPKLLVLDEPVASLDPLGRREFLRELVDDVIERDTTVVFSTHILSDLERVAVDVAFLKDGVIALQSPLDELLDSARRITGPAATLDTLRFADELRRERGAGGTVSIVARPNAAELAALNVQAGQAGLLSAEPLNLEDLFVEVTR
jgi:ABC-2 type transport system ATP-binding protein